MFKRLLVIGVILSLPYAALADDASPSPSPAASQAVQSDASAASTLGPQANSDGTASSTADGTALQPAGQTPLQATTNDSGGLTAPTDSALQAPASSDQLKVYLNGEADGEPQQGDNAASHSLGFNLLLSGLALLVLLAAVIALRWHTVRQHRASFL